MQSRLHVKRESFCQNYLDLLSSKPEGDPELAAELAGYKPAYGWQLIAQDQIQKRIRELQKIREEERDASPPTNYGQEDTIVSREDRQRVLSRIIKGRKGYKTSVRDQIKAIEVMNKMDEDSGSSSGVDSQTDNPMMRRVV